jgi:hypothetical protein
VEHSGSIQLGDLAGIRSLSLNVLYRGQPGQHVLVPSITGFDPGCVEPISKLFEEDNEAGKLDKAKEIVGVVLPANEDPALPLNPGEETLDEPASHVAA